MLLKILRVICGSCPRRGFVYMLLTDVAGSDLVGYICHLTATSGLGGMFLWAFFGLRPFLFPLPATITCYVGVRMKYIAWLHFPLDVAGGAALFMLELLLWLLLSCLRCSGYVNLILLFWISLFYTVMDRFFNWICRMPYDFVCLSYFIFFPSCQLLCLRNEVAWARRS